MKINFDTVVVSPLLYTFEILSYEFSKIQKLIYKLKLNK